MKDAIEMQEKASSKIKDGTKALGQSIVGQFTPIITAVAHDSDMTQTNKETMDRKFTASELANLTLHQVRPNLKDKNQEELRKFILTANSFRLILLKNILSVL